ncbi:MAG: 2-C-methyl-D-erythritol 4-phosphate cytidylyltransferase [Chlamydia sp. 32-24]|nr:MAG: 2-C-methyl-D-erythritol 4-phosphate cytidylyltransferase [Chlamydia sp. 32-24]
MNNSYSTAVILLAGGIGKRMKTVTPKQFLLIEGKPIARYSFDIFMKLPYVKEIVVVCAPKYRHFFPNSHSSIKVNFTDPGERRQDSVKNGLEAMETKTDIICIHDSARPFIDSEMITRVHESAYELGAATTGMPLKFTVKEHDGQGIVFKTHNRDLFWEIQTPQAIKRDLFQDGFKFVQENQIEVTDDVSIVEYIKAPVKLVEGSYQNFKVTTPEDLLLAKHLIKLAIKQTAS